MLTAIKRYFLPFQHYLGKLEYRQWAIAGLTALTVLMFVLGYPTSAWAEIQDDRFDGNIFALYAGNGSLVPPRVTLSQSFSGEKPTLLTFYVEDSKDCKQFSAVISQLQAYYGRAIDFIPINVDSIPALDRYSPDEPGYYYTGQVPQTLLFDMAGTKVLDKVGRVDFEIFDDALRDMFDLLPRSESIPLKPRSINAVNAELVK
ncbi:MAG: thylakoid membrane photosystem I accumulation factor [Thermosynechococcaceae cyanobacterium]